MPHRFAGQGTEDDRHSGPAATVWHFGNCTHRESSAVQGLWREHEVPGPSQTCHKSAVVKILAQPLGVWSNCACSFRRASSERFCRAQAAGWVLHAGPDRDGMHGDQVMQASGACGMCPDRRLRLRTELAAIADCAASCHTHACGTVQRPDSVAHATRGYTLIT